MSQHRVLIIDDEPDIRELLEITLIRMGLDTMSAESVSEAKALLAEEAFNLCLTDMNLPDGNGIDLVSYIQQNYSNMPVAMITAYGSVETAISALKAGAFDFISKPVDLTQLRDLVNSALKLSGTENLTQKAQLQDDLLLGNTEQIHRLKTQVAKLARSQAPVHIFGESGSGKELVARSIHQQGPRANGPFVPLNCGAIPSELMESEFFGHKKGSFSGAIEDKTGLFKAANGGTIFLDEVADLPLSMQVKLLRAIQEKSVRPIGSNQEESFDVRILSATHKNLPKLVEQGEFRQDLYYRINVITLDVPSLRERRDDIEMLALRFLHQISSDCGIEHAMLAPDALAALRQYDFPGNVRELENIIERAFTLCEDNTIRTQDLQLNDAEKVPSSQVDSIQNHNDHENEKAPNIAAIRALTQKLDAAQSSGVSPLTARRPDQSLEDYLEGIERHEIETALNETKWNRTAAAKKLGISFRALRYRLKKLNID